MKEGYSYIARDKKTDAVYAICSADPEFISESAKEIKKWIKRGDRVELLPHDEAVALFCDRLP